MTSEKMCCVPNCGSQNEILHKFPEPNKDPERFRTWLYNIGGDILALDNNIVFKRRRVCNLHFEAQYHTRSKFLSANAIPRLCLSDAGNSNVSGEHSKNKTAVQRKNQTAVRVHSKNKTAVSDHIKKQAAVKINVEDADDDSQYLVVDTHTGADDDCYNISDDDCQAVVDDDSSFYHNASKQSDDKDMEGDPQNLVKNEDLHDGFKCNFCSGEIKGYRYTCVQCPDYDLCGSCEAKGAHCLHYVLRIPRPKPYAEIQPLLSEIRRLLSGDDTDVLWTHPDEIKQESDDEVDPLDSVTSTLSEPEYIVPETVTRTSITKTHGSRQDNNDTVPQVTMQPRIKSHLQKASTYTRQKQTVTVEKRSTASTSSPNPASTRLAPRNTLLTIESGPQASGKSRTPVSKSSQYTASTRLAPRNTLLTIESGPQASGKSRTPVSKSNQYTASTRLAAGGNTVLNIGSSLQAIDKTRTPASDGNTVLTIATNVEGTDGTSRPAPSTSRLNAPASTTPGDTETIYNKMDITSDSPLLVPMGSKRKCSDTIEASKHKVVLLKGSKQLIALPKNIVPGTRFKIIKKPSAAGQPQAPVAAVSAARHRTPSTARPGAELNTNTPSRVVEAQMK